MTSFYIDGKWVELDELVEKTKKFESIEHHFTLHDRMYIFDFNVLMDEVSSEFMEKSEDETI